MDELEVVGIVGAAGDLGNQLLDQVSEKFNNAIAFDIRPSQKNAKATWTQKIESLLDQSAIIHWCGPIKSVLALPKLAKGQLLVLHNSVMTDSLEVAQALKKRPEIHGQIAIVHMLMNQERTVVVNSELDAIETIAEHFKILRWKPTIMNTVDHDVLMAHTQAPMAILVHILLPKLKQYDSKGLLTMSGQALKLALEDRSVAWTDTTLATVLTNPELYGFIDDIKNEVADYQAEAK